METGKQIVNTIESIKQSRTNQTVGKSYRAKGGEIRWKLKQ